MKHQVRYLLLDHLKSNLIGNRTLQLLDSLPSGFYVAYALIQLCNVQQELHDHCRYGSCMNSRMSVLMVTVGEVSGSGNVQEVGELCSRRSVHNPFNRLLSTAVI